MWRSIRLLWRNTSVVWKNKLLWQILIAVAAIAFIVIGVTRGEVPLVFNKAVRVCLECIGLK